MNPQRIGGLVLLVAGVVLFVIGINASHSQADRWTNFWTGHFTDSTVWYLAAGAICAAVGVFLAFAGRESKA